MRPRNPAQAIRFARHVCNFLIAGLLGAHFGPAYSAAPAVRDSPTSRAMPAASAGDHVRSFVSGSLAKIAAERAGRPFVLAFWSATCAYCPSELKTLGDLGKLNPKLEVVLVAADAPEDAPLAAELAARYGLGKVEQWIFADALEERLRFEIDRRWRGELPRTYLYDRTHRIEAVSGILSRAQLLAWIQANVR